MERLYMIRERCQNPHCQNDARYTTASGLRLCGVCSRSMYSLRDSDAPSFISEAIDLLDELDKQGVVAGSGVRATMRSKISVPKKG